MIKKVLNWIANQWVFVKYNIWIKLPSKKLYRNPMHNDRYRSDRCICGTSRKVKNCCGKKPMLTKKELLAQVKMRDEARERIRKELAAKGMKPEDMKVTKIKGKQKRRV